MYSIKKEQAITLIALVVTLVILIILAAVTINMILGDQGIFTQAKKAANSYQESKKNDLTALKDLTNELDDMLASPIPVQTAEQLLKMGTGEKVEVGGTSYYFKKGRTYTIQNNIEFTGSYDTIAELIKNKEIAIQGNGYQIVVTNEEGKQEYYTQASKYYIATNQYGYVLEGLELFLDGKDNVGEGLHDNAATVWKDLSGNNHEGTLHNFGNNAISGWNNEYLSFDGVNDWVACGELNNDNITIEVVHRLKSDTKADRCVVGNWEGGGNGIYSLNGTLQGNLHVNTEYHILDTNLGANFYKNQVITQSLTYNGQNAKIYVDGEEKVNEILEGNIENPQSNTIMVIGANAYADSASAIMQM